MLTGDVAILSPVIVPINDEIFYKDEGRLELEVGAKDYISLWGDSRWSRVYTLREG